MAENVIAVFIRLEKSRLVLRHWFDGLKTKPVYYMDFCNIIWLTFCSLGHCFVLWKG